MPLVKAEEPAPMAVVTIDREERILVETEIVAVIASKRPTLKEVVAKLAQSPLVIDENTKHLSTLLLAQLLKRDRRESIRRLTTHRSRQIPDLADS